MSFWGQKTFCLVTGASRGIGKTIAIEFAKNVAPGSVFVLVARSEGDLQTTKGALVESTAENKVKVHVVIASLDLEKPDPEVYHNLVTSGLDSSFLSANDFDHVLLVHNAGSLGNIKFRVAELEDVQDIQRYFTMNVTSMIILTSQFFKVFNDSSKQRSVVQITSLMGVQPSKTMGLYCSGKACRDMLMKCLALEEGIQVLSWAPGPVETDMFEQCCTQSGDPEMVAQMKEVRSSGTVLSPLQTVSKLIKVLGTKKYVKGEHIDYFDDEVAKV